MENNFTKKKIKRYYNLIKNISHKFYDYFMVIYSLILRKLNNDQYIYFICFCFITSCNKNDLINLTLCVCVCVFYDKNKLNRRILKIKGIIYFLFLF